MKILESKFVQGFNQNGRRWISAGMAREKRWKLKLSSESRRSRDDPSTTERTWRMDPYRC